MNKLIINKIIFLLTAICIPYISSKSNPLQSNLMDVVIPCHDKDLDKLELTLANLKKYAQDIRRIIIVSNKKLSDNAEWFDEKKFPFNKNSIAYEIFQDKTKAMQYVSVPNSRVGWLFQQFVKLYAPFIIPNLSEKILVFDADMILLKPISFIKNNKALFNISTIENHRPYFAHAEKLLANFTRKYPQYSGITHHMVFDKTILKDLFNTIQNQHKLEPWKIMCRLLDKKHIHPHGSAMSEYEIYFNFAFTYHADKVALRPLQWANMSYNKFKKNNNLNLDYAACQSWL